MQELKYEQMHVLWYFNPLNPNETSIRSVIGPPLTIPCRDYGFKKEVPVEECLEGCDRLYVGFGCLRKNPFEHETKEEIATPEKSKSELL